MSPVLGQLARADLLLAHDVGPVLADRREDLAGDPVLEPGGFGVGPLGAEGQLVQAALADGGQTCRPLTPKTFGGNRPLLVGGKGLEALVGAPFSGEAKAAQHVSRHEPGVPVDLHDADLVVPSRASGAEVEQGGGEGCFPVSFLSAFEARSSSRLCLPAGTPLRGCLGGRRVPELRQAPRTSPYAGVASTLVV